MMAELLAKRTEWLYQGLWRFVVEWFRVPDGPPQLPGRPGDTVQAFRPAPNYIRYLRFWFWIALAIVDGVLLLLWVIILAINVVIGLFLMPFFLVVIVLPDIVAYVAIHLRYDSTWYLLSPRSMRLRRGIWTIHETTITFENVQDVTVQQGPVQRMFEIADVIVKTAGGGSAPAGGSGIGGHVGRIEGVANAAAIRDAIMARVRQSSSAGLGDESFDRRSVAAHATHGWTPAHLAELRTIRDRLASWTK